MCRKGDYYRHLAEFGSEGERKEAIQNAVNYFTQASDIAILELPPAHPIRLSLALNFSLFQYYILKQSEKYAPHPQHRPRVSTLTCLYHVCVFTERARWRRRLSMMRLPSWTRWTRNPTKTAAARCKCFATASPSDPVPTALPNARVVLKVRPMWTCPIGSDLCLTRLRPSSFRRWIGGVGLNHHWLATPCATSTALWHEFSRRV
jgi:hypothetical protein